MARRRIEIKDLYKVLEGWFIVEAALCACFAVCAAWTAASSDAAHSALHVDRLLGPIVAAALALGCAHALHAADLEGAKDGSGARRCRRSILEPLAVLVVLGDLDFGSSASLGATAVLLSSAGLGAIVRALLRVRRAPVDVHAVECDLIAAIAMLPGVALLV